MDVYLKHLEYWSLHSVGKDKRDYVRDVLLVNPNQKTREGQYFIIRAIHDYPAEFSTLTHYEYDGNLVQNCEPDVVLNGTTFCEFKSWSDGSLLDPNFEDEDEDTPNTGNAGKGAFFGFKKGWYIENGKLTQNNSFKQFKGLLSSNGVTSMNSFRYYFDARKISGGQPAKENFVKTVFKDMIEIRNDGQGHDHLQEVFDAIWANTNLRADLFQNRNQQDAEDYFRTELVFKIDSKFYSFINVK